MSEFIPFVDLERIRYPSIAVARSFAQAGRMHTLECAVVEAAYDKAAGAGGCGTEDSGKQLIAELCDLYVAAGLAKGPRSAMVHVRDLEAQAQEQARRLQDGPPASWAIW